MDLSGENDLDKGVRFTNWLIKNYGVRAIPANIFYSDANRGDKEHLVRFCFIKNDDHLKAAAEALKKLSKN